MPASTPRTAPIMATLLLAGLVYALAQTVVAPALPAIARGYDTTLGTATWVLTGFLVSASVATPIVGKLGDLYGRGRVLTLVLLTFAVGSVICGLAQSIGVVISGRVLQGVGSGVFPLAFGIIRDTFPRERVGVGIGVLSAMFGIGGGIGLPLAGVIVDNADLSWLFWIGLMAVPAAVAAHRMIPVAAQRRPARIDWAGAAVLSGALVCLLLGVANAGAWGWDSVRVLALLVGGLALGAGWVALERRVAEPLIDLRVLRSRPVAATNLAATLVGFAMFSSFLLIPQFAQTPTQAGYGFGSSVTQAGLIMLPSALVMLVAGPFAGWMGSRIGFRAILATGAGCAALAFAFLAVAHKEVWEFVLAGALIGVGISFAFSSMANLVVESVPQGDVGIATGINTIARTIGGAAGAAAVTAVLTARMVPGTMVPVESGYTTAFVIAAAVGVLALLAALAVPRRPRAQHEPAAEPALA
ncbi:MAG TPA: MFS transporter [Solirubrobacteraceae bacterium]|nr:MFS transporter [Solirubrobacteraceae bacterium]